MRELMNLLCKIQAELFEVEDMTRALQIKQEPNTNAEILLHNSACCIACAFGDINRAISGIRDANGEINNE